MAHPVGPGGGEAPGDGPAHRMADQHEAVEMERVDQHLDEVGVGLDGVFVARPGAGEAVPRQVDGDLAQVRLELARPALPHVQRAQRPVDEDERKRIGPRPLGGVVADMGLHAADIDEFRPLAGIARDQHVGRQGRGMGPQRHAGQDSGGEQQEQRPAPARRFSPSAPRRHLPILRFPFPNCLPSAPVRAAARRAWRRPACPCPAAGVPAPASDR